MDFGKDYPLQPFSFKACCLLAYLDAEVLRENLVLVQQRMYQEKAWKGSKSREGRAKAVDPVTGVSKDLQRLINEMQAIANSERRCE